MASALGTLSAAGAEPLFNTIRRDWCWVRSCNCEGPIREDEEDDDEAVSPIGAAAWSEI